MDKTCVKGERIILTDRCAQTFRGTVKSVNPNVGRILLTDIVMLPDERPILGLRNFDRNEIVELIKLKENILVSEKDVSGSENAELSCKLSQEEREKLKRIQKEFHFIKDLDPDFYSAVSLLKVTPIVGLVAKDISKGRFGRASILAVSTRSHVFVFDLLSLKDECMDEGLKLVLESERTVKVIHDSRLLSDCLKHKHLVQLVNVRDLEAEDVMVVFQERRTIRRHSRSLAYLCEVYLGVPVKEPEGGCWGERPLAGELLDFLVSTASLLLPLQEAIEQKYLRLLVDASNLYNSHVRELDFFDFLYHQPNKTLKKELGKLLIPQNQARGDYSSKKPASG